MNSTVVGACEKTTPAFRPECERKWATQPQTSHPHWKRGQKRPLCLCCLVCCWESVQQHLRWLPRSLRRVSDNTKQRTLVHCAHRVVGSGICALEQDLPGALQVWYRGDGFPQSPFFRDAFFHLLRDVLLRPDGCAQHRDSSRLPHVFPKLFDGLGWDPGSIPSSGFSLVQLGTMLPPTTHTTPSLLQGRTRDTHHPRTRTFFHQGATLLPPPQAHPGSRWRTRAA